MAFWAIYTSIRGLLLMTEMQYLELKDYCLLNGAKYGITKIDCEDILHDACLYILEENVMPNDYKWCVSKYIGKYRERRNRESKREAKISYEQ